MQTDIRRSVVTQSLSLDLNSLIVMCAIVGFVIGSTVTVSFYIYTVLLTIGSSILTATAFITGSYGSSRSGLVLGVPINLFGTYVVLALVSVFYVLINRSRTKSLFEKTFWYTCIIFLVLGLLHSGSYGAIVILFFSSFVLYVLSGEIGISLTMFGISILCIVILSNGINVSIPSLNKSSVPISDAIVEQRSYVESNQDLDVKSNEVSKVDSPRSILQAREASSIADSFLIRLSIYNQFISQVRSDGVGSMFFGKGSSGIVQVLVKVDDDLPAIPHASHSAYLSILQAYGLFAFVLILGFVLIRSVKSFSNVESQGWLGILGVFMVNSFLMDTQWTFLVFILGFCLSQLRPKKQKGKPG